jgi:polyisoprenoid-binding protein YceI
MDHQRIVFFKEYPMRLFTGMLMLVIATSGAVQAKDSTYKLNGDNTKIEWTGTKPDGKHVGGFKKVTGTAKRTNSDVAFEVEIDTGSLYSDDEKLTQHLKSPDFFAVKDHPKAKFKSTKVEKAADGTKVTGELTLLGKTKKISFPAKITADDTLTLDAKFTINRQDFGMSYGTGKVNDDVEIRIDLKAKP